MQRRCLHHAKALPAPCKDASCTLALAFRVHPAVRAGSVHGHSLKNSGWLELMTDMPSSRRSKAHPHNEQQTAGRSTLSPAHQAVPAETFPLSHFLPAPSPPHHLPSSPLACS
eukprot:344714-Chlamydomonas_euryale.AAC.2